VGLLNFFKSSGPDKPNDETKAENSFLVGGSTKSDRRSPKLAEGSPTVEAKSSQEKTYKTSELIHTCVGFISGTASQVKLKFIVRDKKGNEVDILKKGKYKELSNFIYGPNPFSTWGDFLSLSVKSYLLTGNTFISYERQSGKGELWVLTPPSKMKIVPHKKKYIEGYLFADAISYKPDEIIHWKDTDVANEYWGVGVVESLVDSLKLEGYTIDDMISLYENSAIGVGVLQSKFPLTEDQAVALRSQFSALYSRQGNERHKAIALPNGMEYKGISLSPGEAAFIDSLNISEHRVLEAFHLNPIVLGGRLESYTTHVKEVQSATFNAAVRPLLTGLVDTLEMYMRKKFDLPELEIIVDLSRLPELDEAINIKASTAKTLYSSGIASHNEARELIGMPRLDYPESDIYYIPAYLVGSDPKIIGNTPSTISQSTDPQGGAADAPAPTADNNSNNNPDTQTGSGT
jgi:HK97 family phage portal protein